MAVDWQKYTRSGNTSLVKLYQDGLKRLNEKVAKMYQAGVLPEGEILAALKEEVTQLVAQRQVILRANLKRSAADSYHDILHQAARLVNIPVQLTTFSEADAAAAIRIRPKGVPSFEKLLKKHKQNSINQTPVKLADSLKGATTLMDVKRAIRQTLTADANAVMRLFNAEATRVVNNAAVMAFETMTAPDSAISQLLSTTGEIFVSVWVHDSPRFPREFHRDVLDGSLPDRDGYWHQGSDKAKSPGGFSDPSNNYGCRCVIEVMTVKEYLSRYGRSRLQSWSYLPE